jgi:hypothetical protein
MPNELVRLQSTIMKLRDASIRRSAGLIAYLLAAVVVAAALALLVGNLVSSRQPSLAPSALTVTQPSGEVPLPKMFLEPFATPSSTLPIVTMRVSRVDRASGAVDATVSVQLPKRFLRQLVSLRTSQHIVERVPLTGPPILASGYQHLAVRLSVLLRATGQEIDRTLPLDRVSSTFLGGGDFDLATVPLSPVALTIPLETDPTDFPDDWYEGSIFFYVQFPAKLGLGPRRTSLQSMPLETGVAVSAGTSSVRTRFDGIAGGKGGLYVDLVFDTPLTTRLFAYLTALLPLLLVAGAFALSVIRPAAFGVESALALALGTLAVFAIRSISVPSDVVGPTRLDLMLGVDLACAVGVAFLGIGRMLRASL